MSHSDEPLFVVPNPDKFVGVALFVALRFQVELFPTSRPIARNACARNVVSMSFVARTIKVGRNNATLNKFDPPNNRNIFETEHFDILCFLELKTVSMFTMVPRKKKRLFKAATKPNECKPMFAPRVADWTETPIMGVALHKPPARKQRQNTVYRVCKYIVFVCW